MEELKNDAFLTECPYCGAKLESLGITLNEEELDKQVYSENLVSNAQTALEPDVINKLKLTEDEMAIYFRTAFDQIAKGRFLYWAFEKDLKKSHNIDVGVKIFIHNGEVYKHGI